MTRSHSSRLYSAWRTLRYTDIDDDNALVTAVATATSQATFTAASLDGAMANPGPAFTKMHQLCVVTSASVGSYNIVDEITATCTDQFGVARTLTATLTDVNGGETVIFADSDGNELGAMTCSSIVVPAQNDTSGQFEFGVRDVMFDEPARELRGGAAGNIAVLYEVDLTIGEPDDVLPCLEGEHHTVSAWGILDTATDTTATDAFPVTAYL